MNRIWTIGHSTRTIEEFVSLLAAYSITLVADVRQFPGSRRYPQFNKEALPNSLAAQGIKYVHFTRTWRPAKAKEGLAQHSMAQ